MKITKQRLNQIIKEEIDKATVSTNEQEQLSEVDSAIINNLKIEGGTHEGYLTLKLFYKGKKISESYVDITDLSQ